MGLRFILGRSGTGKTGRCLSEIREQLGAAPIGPPLIMLVPEQATFQTEYELLSGDQGYSVGAPLSGTLRAQALSFRRLAFRVMQETGGTALTPIGDTGKHMLLYKIVERNASRLELFQGGAGQPGFIDRLAELITEWKRYGLTSAELVDVHKRSETHSPMLRRKLHDLTMIYDQLESELAGKYVDAEDYLTHLREGFGKASAMRGARFWIDGFHGFTPAEYEAIGALLSASADLNVTLTLDREYELGELPHELDLFHPAAETYGKLLALAGQHGAEILNPLLLNGEEAPPRFAFNRTLAHLEKHFDDRVPLLPSRRSPTDGVDLKTDISRESPFPGLSLHAVSSRRAEVESVARDMIRRAREDGIRWRDMAVLVRNAEDYANYLSIVFTDYRIPYFIDQREKAAHHPLVEFIRSALETVLQGWHYDAVFRCIKTELLFGIDDRLPREWFDLLENFVLASGIDGWKWQDAGSWRPQAAVSLEEDSEMETVISEASRQEFELVMKAREAIVPSLAGFEQSLRKAGNVTQMCEALYRLLDRIQAADRLERWSDIDLENGNVLRSRTHRQLWGNVMDLLDQMVELAGEETLSPELFAGMVEAGLDSMNLASVPPALDQVLVGSMDRTRAGKISVCFVLGANDGIMPMRVQEDGILTEAERERLAEDGLQLAPSVRRRLLDERFMIYNAFTKPSAHLWISWAQADEEGKTLLPSEIIRQLRKMFPGIAIQEEHLEPTPSMTAEEQKTFLQLPGRTLTSFVSMLRNWQQGDEIPPFWWDLYNWYAVRPQWQDRLQLLLRSLAFDNRATALSEAVAADLYGVRMQVSVSRLERFVSCPFQHFAIHGLKLRERKLYRLNAPDVGQLFHAALSQLAKELGETWGRKSSREIREASDRTVDAIVPKLQSQILLSSGRMQFIARKLKEVVAGAAIALGEHARRAVFRPVGMEVGFGPDGELPSLVLPLGGGHELEVIGRIDRVDAAETDQGLLLRVMDYKSSSTALRLEEVIHGLSLQMLTYLDVLITFGQEWLGKPADPAGVLYFHVHNPMLSLANRIEEKEANAERLKRYKPKGLLTADAEIVRLMDEELETGQSEVLPVGVKKDGSFYSSSSVISQERWTILRRMVRERISQIGSDVQAGEVKIEPYRLEGRTPCQFCHYKSLCQFDPLFDGNAFKKLSKPTKDEVWQELEKE
ncbi:helicase-exonuclease AddAB subunit AddB [Paenibacillus sp. HB172176]|uniref:helicase-exonuclease AddAB subunit AddB n=1 Tax=Paenibacillus sp. HB172176 TaxID=2493690 RepID=UPI00143895BD|nr:helicase-exonuclease AddAB subunit AddB [Paenibacillus sp. HB172176]